MFAQGGIIRPGAFEALQTIYYSIAPSVFIRFTTVSCRRMKQANPVCLNLLGTLNAPRGRAGARD
jgi:hypothetical protein